MIKPNCEEQGSYVNYTITSFFLICETLVPVGLVDDATISEAVVLDVLLIV